MRGQNVPVTLLVPMHRFHSGQRGTRPPGGRLVITWRGAIISGDGAGLTLVCHRVGNQGTRGIRPNGRGMIKNKEEECTAESRRNRRGSSSFLPLKLFIREGPLRGTFRVKTLWFSRGDDDLSDINMT